MARMVVNKKTGAITFIHTEAEKAEIARKRRLKEKEDKLDELTTELEEKLAKLDKLLEKLEEKEEDGGED